MRFGWPPATDATRGTPREVANGWDYSASAQSTPKAGGGCPFPRGRRP